MKYLQIILGSLVISLLTLYVFVFYVPLGSLEATQTFGATITTIAGTDTLSSSRAVINTNFSNLNTDKFETTGTTLASLTSAASLATIGTITAGVWNGTTIATAYGGTGSTTLASNQILLGNGTGNIGIVSGFGSSGQFLTSNGASSAPTWQTSAIDQTISYNFTGTTFRIKNLLASSTSANPINLNGLDYNTPSTHASSTVFMNDGSGNLTNKVVKHKVSINLADVTISSSDSEKTLIATTTIPANILGTNDGLSIEAIISDLDILSADTWTFNLRYGNQTIATALLDGASNGNKTNMSGTINAKLYANGTSAQEGSIFVSVGSGTFPSASITLNTKAGVGTGTVDSTSSQDLVITAKTSTNSASNSVTSAHALIEHF